MSKAYASLKETFKRGKDSFIGAANARTFGDEIDELHQLILNRIDRLKGAVKEGEAVVTAEAAESKQLIDRLTENVTKLEVKIKETENTIRERELTSRKTEETLTTKVQQLEVGLKEKEQ